MSIFSERLKKERSIRGLSQQQMADQMGVTLRQYTRYESDICDPPLSKAAKAADVLLVTLDYLAGRTD